MKKNQVNNLLDCKSDKEVMEKSAETERMVCEGSKNLSRVSMGDL